MPIPSQTRIYERTKCFVFAMNSKLAGVKAWFLNSSQPGDKRCIHTRKYPLVKFQQILMESKQK